MWRAASREAGVSARLREAIFAAHAEAVRAVTAATEAGLGVNRDLVELIELQRRIIRIADQFEDAPPVADTGAPAADTISVVPPTGSVTVIPSNRSWPPLSAPADSHCRAIDEVSDR